MNTDQRSADYAAVLEDLERQRSELDSAIAVVKRMLGRPVGEQDAATTGKSLSGSMSLTLTPTAFFGMSVGDAAKKYLAIVKEPKSAPEIAKALLAHGLKTMSKNFTQIVVSSLDRRVETGEVVRPKRGLWGLKEWYPGARVPNKTNGGDSKSEEPASAPAPQKKTKKASGSTAP